MSQVLKRHKLVGNWLNNYQSSCSVLDAGAREGVLSSLLSSDITYTASDKNTPGKTNFVDLNKPLPFPETSFDSVVCLDVLEHLSDPWFTMTELFRVARSYVIISFPNQAYISFRLRFLFRGVVSGKYSFSPEMLSDRHQWLTTYDQYIDFVSSFSNDFSLIHNFPIIPERGRGKILTPFESFLSKLYPNLWVYGNVFIFKRQ